MDECMAAGPVGALRIGLDARGAACVDWNERRESYTSLRAWLTSRFNCMIYSCSWNDATNEEGLLTHSIVTFPLA